jgi:murein DD-endopeptidase MepM/ murein hydrolase activator NlpD
MSIINNKVSQVTLDIKATQTKLEQITLEIKSLNLEIKNKQTTIGQQQKILAELLRNIKFNEGKTYLEIATTYKTFSNFYNCLQQLEIIDKELGRVTKAIRLAKEDLQTKQQQAEEKQQNYVKTNDQLKDKKSDLQDELNVKQNLLAQTQSSEAKYKTLVTNLTKQYQQIEGEVESIEKNVRQKLAKQNKLSSLGDSDAKFSWPAPSKSISSYFHDQDYPYRKIFEHNGVDIRAAHGTPIRAAASGYVAQAKFCSTASCYSYIMLIHDNGLATVYGHLSKIVVSNDQFITRGDIIGYSGGTPGSVGAGPFVTGPHLHFEVRLNGIPVNPLNYLQ